MDDVRGIADQTQPFIDKLAGGKQPKRKCASRSDDLEFAELQAKPFFQFRMKLRVGKPDDTLRFTRVLRPDNRATPAGQRQDCEWACRQKMLFGAAIVFALMPHLSHDPPLAVTRPPRTNPP